MARSLFFTNHLQVLSALAERPDLRQRDIAAAVCITERATQRIITELIEEGYLARTRVGARNRYAVNAGAALPDAHGNNQTAAHAIRLLIGAEASEDGHPAPEPQPSPGAGRDDAQMLRRMFAAAPAGMVIADASGRLLAANLAFCQIVGRPENELVGRDFREWTHPDDIAAFEEGLRQLASGERSEYVREKRYILPSGSAKWVA
ncbi:MAG: PAS domain S-box protein, partial [Solirubrobacteraceae bacterium]